MFQISFFWWMATSLNQKCCRSSSDEWQQLWKIKSVADLLLMNGNNSESKVLQIFFSWMVTSFNQKCCRSSSSDEWRQVSIKSVADLLHMMMNDHNQPELIVLSLYRGLARSEINALCLNIADSILDTNMSWVLSLCCVKCFPVP